MGYAYYKRPNELDIKDIRRKWTVWTEEGINNPYTYVYENGDTSDARGWQCVTVICKPGLEIDYQWCGLNKFALNNILGRINETRIKLDAFIEQEKKQEEERRRKEEERKVIERRLTEEKKKKEEEERIAKQDKYTDFCTWHYGTKIVDIFHNEDKHFKIAVDKIIELVTSAVELNCGNIPSVMNILKNMNIELGKSKSDNKKTKNICKKEIDENGHYVYLISEYTLDWKRKVVSGVICNGEVKDVSVDLNMRIFSPENEKAKEECERLLNKCIKGGIISDIVKEYDGLKGGR
jgi:hypothetical protein